MVVRTLLGTGLSIKAALQQTHVTLYGQQSNGTVIIDQ